MKNLNLAFNSKTFFDHGWVNIPRKVIEYFNATSDAPYGTLEAMLTIIIHVNYSETSYQVKSKKVNCNRGESVRSITDWAKIFHWSRYKTGRYFKWLQSIGYIQFIDDPNCRCHFAVLPYEEIVFGPKYVSVQKQTKGMNRNNRPTKNDSEEMERNEAMAYDEEMKFKEEMKYKEAMERNKAMEYESNVFMETKENGENRLMMGNESQQLSYESQLFGNESQYFSNESQELCYEPQRLSNGSQKLESESQELTNESEGSEMTQPKSLRRTRKEIATFKHQKFIEFWNAYYETTGLQHKNIGKAEFEWNKLSNKERKLAFENIDDYYYSQSNIYFILQPANYLANKAFLDDF